VTWAVFLDRDGVILDPVLDPAAGRHESPYRPEDVALTPEAADGLRVLRELGAPLVLVSNQPSVAKGQSSPEAMSAVHEAMRRRLAEQGLELDDYRYCFHHPEGTHPELGRACRCRKPEAGLLLDAAEALGGLDMARSWMIGDSDADVEAGRRAGCRTILIEHPRSAHRRSSAAPEARAPDLLTAARMVADGTGRPFVPTPQEDE
jgi:D-glycero-D-manno-heptose 1,7-bisphosphate phosphatase